MAGAGGSSGSFTGVDGLSGLGAGGVAVDSVDDFWSFSAVVGFCGVESGASEVEKMVFFLKLEIQKLTVMTELYLKREQLARTKLELEERWEI